MAGRGVISVMFIILVVGLGTSDVKANKVADRKMLIRVRSHSHSHSHARTHAHVHHGHSHNTNAQGGLEHPINGVDSMKIVNGLCATTTYKDTCIKSLGSLTQSCGNNPQEYFTSGVKLALDETTKASNLPNTLLPKASTEIASSTLKTCTDLLEQATDRLKMVVDQVGAGDLKTTLKDPGNIFNIRLELGDVNTFSTSCLDEFGEVEAPELQKVVQDGIANAKELAVNLLDIVSTYNF